MLTLPPLPSSDLDSVVFQVGSCWRELRGARILLTGGTGFFGAWLLETLCHADEVQGLGLKVWVLSRNPEGFCRRFPHLADRRALFLIPGDVREFAPPSAAFTHVIHGATSASAVMNSAHPEEMLDTIVAGTRHVLGLANRSGLAKMLFISSGAVYGEQPPQMERIPEAYLGGPNPLDPSNAYAEGKRMAELLCVLWSRRTGIPVTIARGFAFVGPHLPLDVHFAMGNFLRDALERRPIVVEGDGTPIRSYLYASDLAVWLWKILISGHPGTAYNIGSDQAVSIRELAQEIGVMAQVPVEVRQAGQTGMLPKRYVPSIARASELGLTITVDRQEAIRRTLDWHRSINA